MRRQDLIFVFALAANQDPGGNYGCTSRIKKHLSVRTRSTLEFSMAGRLLISLYVVLGVFFTAYVAGHEHHDEALPPGQVITFDPVDSILWTHIFFMALAFGVLFPTGMVKSSRRSAGG